jgi:hypothetical protein
MDAAFNRTLTNCSTGARQEAEVLYMETAFIGLQLNRCNQFIEEHPTVGREAREHLEQNKKPWSYSVFLSVPAASVTCLHPKNYARFLLRPDCSARPAFNANDDAPPRLPTVFWTGQFRQPRGRRRPSLPSGSIQMFKRRHSKPPRIIVPPEPAGFDRCTNLPTNTHVGRTIWDATPSATLVTDTSIEGWGAIMHSQGKRVVNLPRTPATATNNDLL